MAKAIQNIKFSLPVVLVDHDGEIVPSKLFARKLDGLACHTDTALNYSEFAFAEECGLRGGYPRLTSDEKGRLLMQVEVDSQRPLTRNELRELKKDFGGQLTDGIGAGCFDQLSVATGLSVEPQRNAKPKCTLGDCAAWRPKATTGKGNKLRIEAAKKLIDRRDSNGAQPATPKRKTTRVIRKSNRTSANTEGGAETTGELKKPNLKKLYRLLAKPERSQYFDQIKAEVQACGNDLNSVRDGEYPYGNLNDSKLLGFLLKAGLPPNTIDAKGNSLLVQAAVDPRCVQLLLKNGADVNQVCDSRWASTALIRAANLGKLKTVELLLKHGADPAIRDKSGKASWELVDKRARGRQAIVDLLKSHESK